MKLAELKRTIKVGQTWRAYHHALKKDMGVRKVKRIQTNAITFEQPDGNESWLYWPKAKDFISLDEKSFSVWENGERLLTYERAEDKTNE